MNTRYLALLTLGAGTFSGLAYGQTAVTPETAAPAALAAPTPAQPTPAPTMAEINNTPTAPAVQATMPVAPVGPDPVPGDSAASVVAALGKPNGVITMPDKTIMMFERGNVMLSAGPNGVVTEVRLMPASSYAAKIASQESDNAQRQSTRARSSALLDLLMNDPSYLAMSTRDRLMSLSRFERDHPGSSARQEYADLMTVYAAELATQSKMTDLQNQLNQARAETAAAQDQIAGTRKELELAQQQAAAAQQVAVAAQRQAAVVQQTNVNLAPTNAPTIRTGGGGIAITPGNGAPPAPRITPGVDRNGQITNPPPGGVLVVMPDGTIKMITPQNPQGTVVRKGS